MAELVDSNADILMTYKDDVNGGPPAVSEPHSDAWLHKVFVCHSLAVFTTGMDKRGSFVNFSEPGHIHFVYNLSPCAAAWQQSQSM